MNEKKLVLDRCGAKLPLAHREALLSEIAKRISTGMGIADVDSVEKALQKREELGSTGLEKGIAIPHCSIPGAPHFVAGVITLKEPIDFNALDGQKSDIFVFLSGPEARRTDHVRFLAALTSQLRNADVRERMRSAEKDEDLYRMLQSGIDVTKDDDKGPYSIILIYVQDEDVYEPILEAVAGESDASVSVSEAKSAGSILHRMPLFATFWNEQETRDVHRIEVVLPRDRVNRAIRQVEEIAGPRSGVQISAIDLSYGNGVLEL